MLGALIALWVISFFVTFLVAQKADREAGHYSTLMTLLNLVLCSIPVLNVAFVVGWWLIRGDN